MLKNNSPQDSKFRIKLYLLFNFVQNQIKIDMWKQLCSRHFKLSLKLKFAQFAHMEAEILLLEVSSVIIDWKII